MKWNDHSTQVPPGAHAFLGASKYSWLNYTQDQLISRFIGSYSQEIGTVLHELAKKLITYKIRLNQADKHLVLFYLYENHVPHYAFSLEKLFTNLASYVKDAIGFRMDPEVVLYYSENCFGTADTISFRDNVLRIHDLKTGTTPASFLQLRIYAALFCLEYKQDPHKIQIELRIYQGDEVVIDIPEPDEIQTIMEQIPAADNEIKKIKGEYDE